MTRSILAALLVLSPSAAASTELYFTEYVEGTSNNKALEIWNDTGAAVDLSSYSVKMYFNGSTSAGLTIKLSGTLADGDVFVLAHSSADPAILAVADQTAGGGWFNGDDAVALLKGTTNVDVIGQIGFDPGSEWGSGDTSTQDNTIRRLTSVTGGDGNGSDAFDPTIEWSGHPTNTFDGLGQYPDGGGGPTEATIPEIQGAGHDSPHLSVQVKTTGIVTAVGGNGFFLQDAAGDSDDTTSDGLFVFTATAPTVVAGDEVEVIGTVSEFQPGGPTTSNLTITELTGPTIALLSSGNPLPAPVLIGAAGRLPPTEVIDDDAFALFDPASDGIDFWETLEGMRVAVDGAVAVSARNRFDEIFAVADGGATATRINARGGITVAEDDFNPERIQVQLDATLTPGFDPTVATGDALDGVVGVMSYSFGNFELLATEPFTVTSAGLLPEITPPSPPDDVLTIATFNVLNLDPKVESLLLVGSSADIDDDVGDGRFDALAGQIVTNLRAPAIVALEEIQDNDGAEQTSVTDASLTYTTLIAAITAAGGPTYDWRDIAPVDDSSGGQPGGNIRVGFLFDPLRVALDESSLQALVDPDHTDGDAFQDSRLPLEARFEFQGRRFTVIINHLSSKGGSTPLFGLVQPPVNGSEDQRLAQAAVVNDRVDALLLADPAADVIVLGDLNEFDFLDPLSVLKGDPTPVLFNLADALASVERYSYVFDGNSQDLDHVLATAGLAAIGAVDFVHVNPEFGGFASDHDPLAATFAYPEVCQPDLGFGGPGAMTLSVCGDPLRPTGVATLEIAGVPAGATGFLLFGDTYAPFPFLGGTLAMVPISYFVLTDFDLDGVIALDVPGDLADLPVSIFAQFAALNPAAPPKFFLSNAVEVQFLGL
jgi:predicted extracellular nuclease